MSEKEKIKKIKVPLPAWMDNEPGTEEEKREFLADLIGEKKASPSNDIYDEIKAERKRQNEKWGEQNHHPLYWLNILMEEVGETSQAALQLRHEDYRREMLQCAAVAIAALESYDRDMWDTRSPAIKMAAKMAKEIVKFRRK